MNITATSGNTLLTIGDTAKAAGLSTKTVRYYADVDLVAPSGRSSAGYRLYTDTEVHKLRFIRQARAFGFSLEECRELLSLYEDKSRSSRDVKKIALSRLAEIESRMAELQSLHDELARLAQTCKGDDRPDCPILTSFSTLAP